MKVFYFNITYRCNSNCVFCAANHPLKNDMREMSVEEFARTLQEKGVSAEDRVIINGGEPTVHRAFWDILDCVDQTGALIDLYTNGIKLKDPAFAEKLLAHKKIHIRVPLFGSSPQVHDSLTGVSGNFDATAQGLDILCRHLPNDATFEIKMLLSKATLLENEKIYDLIRSRWNHKALKITLNPLLISECVIQNKELFIDTYESMMEASEPLIRRILKDGMDFSVGLVPYCSFPNQELLALCHGDILISKDLFYASPGYKTHMSKLDYRKPCMRCRFVEECNGFPKSYIEYFGLDVIKPFE